LKQEALEFPPNFDILLSLVNSTYQTISKKKKKTPTISKINLINHNLKSITIYYSFWR
jgi:hypothetical protein